MLGNKTLMMRCACHLLSDTNSKTLNIALSAGVSQPILDCNKNTKNSDSMPLKQKKHNYTVEIVVFILQTNKQKIIWSLFIYFYFCIIINLNILVIWSIWLTLMCSCACLSRLRVVFLAESEDRGTCCFSCSKQCFNWALLHSNTCSNITFNYMQNHKDTLHFTPA